MAKNIPTLKNWLKYFIFCGLTLTAVFYSSTVLSDWQQRMGEKVVFIEGDSSPQKYGYVGIYPKPEIGRSLPYKDYVGRKGRIIGLVSDKYKVSTFWEIQLETGEKVYAHKLREFDDQIKGLYFVDDYQEAKGKIGKFIWINQKEWKVREQLLITEDRNVSYPLEHLE
ncbi:MAG: hypothetical protein QMC83_09160 [Thermodesulfovibrionales bacterium]|nr:hypothetical protein [Thermodesulfovibrionales bacterium]